MNIAQKLKELRTENGLSQEKLATETKIRQSCISAWETGYRTPQAEAIVKLANYFECSTDYLLGRESEDGIITINNNNNCSENEQLLLVKYRKLNQQQRYMTFGYIDGLIAE